MDIRKAIIDGLFALVSGIADLLGLKLGIIVGEHKIRIKSVYPDKKKSKRYYDGEHYYNGNIYKKENANPIKISEQNDNIKLISSEKYKRFFEIDILKKIGQVTKGAVQIKGMTAVMVMLGIQLVLIVFIFLIVV